jgi:hypothetical protein
MLVRLLAILIFVSSLKGQNRLVVFSPDTNLFTLKVNGLTLTKKPVREFETNIYSSDTLQLELLINNSITYTNTIYILEKGKATENRQFFYALEKDKKNNNFKLKYLGFHVPKETPIPRVPMPPVIDTSYKWRNNVFGTLFELKNGKVFFFDNIVQEKSCEKAMSNDNLEHALKLLNRTQIDGEKYKYSNEIVKYNCISCSQLAQLLKALNFELDKIKLVKEAYSNISDKENFKTLESYFRFESSKKEFRELTSNTGSMLKNKTIICYKPIHDSIHGNLVNQLRLFDNDYHRYNFMKEKAANYCFSSNQFKQCLNVLVHDREKLDLTKFFINNITDKENLKSIGDVFSYNETRASLNEYIKQNSK